LGRHQGREGGSPVEGLRSTSKKAVESAIEIKEGEIKSHKVKEKAGMLKLQKREKFKREAVAKYPASVQNYVVEKIV
jgi:hypothetical protein